MKLIDVDSLMEFARNHKDGKVDCNDIARFPTIDAVPVAHGRWECQDGDFSDNWKCSACGIEWFFEYDPTETETKVNYCPDCGAKMDGDCE